MTHRRAPWHMAPVRYALKVLDGASRSTWQAQAAGVVGAPVGPAGTHDPDAALPRLADLEPFDGLRPEILASVQPLLAAGRLLHGRGGLSRAVPIQPPGTGAEPCTTRTAGLSSVPVINKGGLAEDWLIWSLASCLVLYIVLARKMAGQQEQTPTSVARV